MPYGFPTGKELGENICALKSLTEDTKEKVKLLCDAAECKEHEFRAFIEDYECTRSRSIDEFLELRDDLWRIGKTALCYILANHERYPGTLPDDDWICLLLKNQTRHARTPNEALDILKNVSFYTFNYDRFLEHRIITFLNAKYGKNKCEKANVADIIEARIDHGHGKLGNLKERAINRNFETSSELSQHTKSISLWFEGSRNPDAWSDLNYTLKGAQQVGFIGFGFHEFIMDRFSDGIFENKKIFMSTFGMPRSKVDTIRDRLKPKSTDIYGDTLNFHHSDKDESINDFLKRQIFCHKDFAVL